MTLTIRSCGLLFAIAGALVAGCGDKKPEKKSGNQQQTSTPSQASASNKPSRPAAPVGNRSTPLESYKELTKGADLMAHYFRLSGIPEDLSNVAERVDQSYSYERDAFKKRDLLVKFRETVSAQVDEAKKSPYVWVNLPEAASVGKGAIGTFDFEKKAFPLGFFLQEAVFEGGRNQFSSKPVPPEKNPGPGLAYGDNNYSSIYFSNWRDFEFLPMPDEAKAKELEGLKNKLRSNDMRGVLQVRAYLFINDLAGESNDARVRIASNSIRAQIMKVQLLDVDGKVLAEK